MPPGSLRKYWWSLPAMFVPDSTVITLFRTCVACARTSFCTGAQIPFTPSLIRPLVLDFDQRSLIPFALIVFGHYLLVEIVCDLINTDSRVLYVWSWREWQCNTPNQCSVAPFRFGVGSALESKSLATQYHDNGRVQQVTRTRITVDL